MIKKIIITLAIFFMNTIAFAEICLPWQELNPEDWYCYCPDWSIDKHRFWCINRLNNSTEENLWKSINKISEFLQYLIIPLSMIVLIYWGFQYTTSMWDDIKIKKAKKIIFIALSSIILYIFYYVFIDLIYQLFS